MHGAHTNGSTDKEQSMNASIRTLFSPRRTLLGTSLFVLTAIPAGLMAQQTATPASLRGQKTNAPLAAAKPIIPGPPILHRGAADPVGSGVSATNADDVRQDASDPTRAHNATTGQDLTWDPDKKSWVDSKSGQDLGFNGMYASNGSIIPAPPILHHGGVLPTVEGINPHDDADNVEQYSSDPDHAYDRTTHQSLYWDVKRQSWVEITSNRALGYDGAPIASPTPTPAVSQPAVSQPAGAPTTAQAPASAPAAKQQARVGMRPDYASDFTLGWAGGVSWTRPTGSLAGTSPQTVTNISLPSQQYFMQWNVARRVSLGMYLGGSYLKEAPVGTTPGASATTLNFGLEPDIYFLGRNRSRDLRLFVGPGLWYNYTDVTSGAASAAAHQFAASGIVGAELPIWSEGRLRFGVEYGHDFQNTTDDLAAANYYAVDLGLMFDAPGGLADDYTDYENAYLPAFSIRYGSELGFSSYGSMGGVSVPNEYSVALPTATVGGYAGLLSSRQLRIGSELDFTRVSEGAASTTYLGLEPGVEYYLMPHAYRGWDVRLRAFDIAEYADATLAGSGYGVGAHGWLSGYGGEAMLTHHFLGPQLVGFGLNYSHINVNGSLTQPSQNTVNLKFTIDSRLF
jgi:hypothetical protein